MAHRSSVIQDDDGYIESRPVSGREPGNEKLIRATKLRIRQLFLDDSKCELCEKVAEEDGYDGQNEGCEKGLCIECAIDKALREFARAIRADASARGKK